MPAPPSPATRWDDAEAPTDARVADLIARMSLREKVAQLYGVWVGIDAAGGEVAPHQHELTGPDVPWEELIADGIGQLTRPFGTAPVDPGVGARSLAASQRAIVAAGRWGIPALVHEECLTGLAAWRSTVYPSPLGWGATFDPGLIERMGAQIGTTMRNLGVHQGLAPVLDVTRDLRWGRTEETIGEDPYLVGIIGSAYVRGLESAGVIATLKHFVGYSSSRAGRNLAPVSIGSREVADVLLPPFELALRAGARSVMNSYADVDGVPVAADPGVLTDLLRDEYGFTGTVVSDYFAIAFLHRLHGVAVDEKDAARLALTAGIDVELPAADCYGQPLIEAVNKGDVEVELIDRALRRVLTQKCELGLLDAGWDAAPPGSVAAATRPDEAAQLDAAATLPGSPGLTLDPAESRELAGEIARRSIVLLHNADVLPLTSGSRVAVVGPLADASSAMMGCYSFPMHVGVHHPDVPLGIELPTVRAALVDDPAGYEVTYALGCAVTASDDPPSTDAEIDAAVRVARDADVCVAVLGDRAGLFGGGTSGEGCDAADLRLPGRQEQLLDALLASGTPVVAVLLVGRPYELSRQIERLAAVVCGFFPGEDGAGALADVLAGRIDPSGRLPVHFPRAGANQPSTYLAARLGQRNEVSTIDPTPLFPFGHGLSYARPVWTAIDTDPATTWSTDDWWHVQVTLRNESARTVSEVVQVYLHDPVAEVARPVQILIAAARADLTPGTERTVDIGLHTDQLSYTGRAGFRQVDPGPVEIWVGASSTDIRAWVPVTVTGPGRRVGFDRVMTPIIAIHGAG